MLILIKLRCVHIAKMSSHWKVILCLIARMHFNCGSILVFESQHYKKGDNIGPVKKKIVFSGESEVRGNVKRNLAEKQQLNHKNFNLITYCLWYW